MEKQITYENTEKAFNEFFGYTAIFWWGIALNAVEQFSTHIKNVSEDERKVIRDRDVSYSIHNFQDARKIFGF